MTSNNKEWQNDFKDEFGIHFKNSSGELQFALSFIDELLSKQRKEVLEILTDEIATAHTSKAGITSRLTSAYMRIKKLK